MAGRRCAPLRSRVGSAQPVRTRPCCSGKCPGCCPLLFVACFPFTGLRAPLLLYLIPPHACSRELPLHQQAAAPADHPRGGAPGPPASPYSGPLGSRAAPFPCNSGRHTAPLALPPALGSLTSAPWLAPRLQLFPDMAEALQEMQSATNWEEAKASGRIDPAPVRGGHGVQCAAAPAGCIGCETRLRWAGKALRGQAGGLTHRPQFLWNACVVVEA